MYVTARTIVHSSNFAIYVLQCLITLMGMTCKVCVYKVSQITILLLTNFSDLNDIDLAIYSHAIKSAKSEM